MIAKFSSVLLLGLVLVFATPSLARAQASVSVDIAKASLAWTWTQGSGSPVTEFHAKCGATTGTYSKTTVLADPLARAHPIHDLITGPGEWFCIVTAANTFGESGASNEVHFFTGSTPNGTLTLQLVAQ